MRLLLDTHVLLWTLSRQSPLGPRAREVITSPDNDVFVSAATVWEMAIKRALGKLTVPDNLTEAITETGFTELPVTFFHAEQAGSLPLLHRDPFDRMLIAQAQAEGLVIATVDSNIPRYPVRTLPADR